MDEGVRLGVYPRPPGLGPPLPPTTPPSHEPPARPDIFSADVSPHVRNGLARGLSRMWEGTRHWSEYEINLGENAEAKLITEEDSYYPGNIPKELIIGIKDDNRRRTLTAKVRGKDFYDPMLNTTDYDRVPHYPESAVILDIEDERTVDLGEGITVSKEFTVRRDREGTVVSEKPFTVVTPLTEAESEGVEIEWDWEGDDVITEPNAAVYTKERDQDWDKTYVNRDRRGRISYPYPRSIWKEGTEFDDFGKTSLSSDERAKIEEIVARAGDLTPAPHENVVNLVGREIQREPKPTSGQQPQ